MKKRDAINPERTSSPTKDKLNPVERSTQNLQVQAMRAIAVLMVILFHLGAGLNRGYLGVDIFFVISGYVITLKAVKEIQVSGNFKVGEFLARRCFRLIPALSATLAGAAILSFFFQTPFQPIGQQQVTAKTGLSGILFTANFQIPKISSGYFGTLAQNNAMTHLWSTSVEGQFYIFYALAILILIKSNLRLNGILIFSLLTVFVSATAYFNGNNSEIFFSTFARAWEFCLGIALAIGISKLLQMEFHIPPWLSNFTSYFSALLIITAQTSLFRSNTHSHLIATLIGTMGLLSLSTLFPAHPTGRLLKNKSLVRIGNASYSIYLWHWPLIIFLGLTWENSGLYSLVLLPLSVGFGLASYFLLEKKFKYIPNKSKLDAGKILASTLIAVLALGSLGFGAKAGWGITWYGLSNPPKEILGNCKTFTVSAPSCLIESDSHRKKILVVGDSQAGTLAKPFINFAKEKDWDFYLISYSGDPYLDSRCDSGVVCNDERTNLIMKIKPDYLIIANLWNLQTPSSDAKIDLEKKLLQPLRVDFNLKNTRIVIISPIPIVKHFETKFTFFNRYILRNWQFKPEINKYQKMIRHLLEAKKQKISTIYVIDPYTKICSPAQCNLLNEEFSLYRDASHLTPDGGVYAIGNLDILD